MTKNIIIAALAVMLAALGTLALAGGQQTPPAAYTGTVTINGDAAPRGTNISAMMGDTICAENQTGRSLNNDVIDDNRYVVQILQEDCDGSITFLVNGRNAGRVLFNNSGGVNTLDLSASTTPTPTPTPSPTPTPTPGPISTPDASRPDEPMPIINIEVRVWEDVRDPTKNYISARYEGGSWRTLGTIPLPLTDGMSRSGRFRYGDIILAVPVTRP